MSTDWPRTLRPFPSWSAPSGTWASTSATCCFPGIEGMTEDEVVHLFTEAHRPFAAHPAG
ncbi:hypothetical protein CYJ76_05525 [Kytococcus schroeteri]|uniref:Uncharacterized protein n=1 Tax=Kytococcus schroeteri TaxID=138300 RepID=A0A2I1PBA3_9MICO|nr:hypothetical protein CYJ76_05525 [Kytococcus schroeteri]